MVIKLQVPQGTKIIVSKGQKVAHGEPFYSHHSEETHSIDVANELGIKPADIFAHVKGVVGDSVAEGATIAEKKKLLKKKKIQSPIAGTITKIDHDTGTVHISTLSKDGGTVPAFFTGEIKEIDSNDNLIHIEVGNTYSFDIQADRDSGGEIFVIDEIDYFQISEDEIKDRILVTDTVQSHIEAKAEALGACGLLYNKGDSSSSMPSAKIPKKEELEKLKKGKYTYVIFSTYEKKGFAYN